MKKLLVAGLCLVLVGYWMNRPKDMPVGFLDRYEGERRIDKASMVGGVCSTDRCLTIYVAPWCPYCTQLTPVIDQMARDLQSEGVSVALIVGSDSLGKVKAYAKKYSVPVYEDANGDYYRSIGVTAVPYFAVTNASGKIVETMLGGYTSVASMRQELGI